MKNYEQISGCKGENIHYFVSRNYQVFIGKTLSRVNLMEYNEETKHKFIVSPYCLEDCENPCRVLKFGEYKCLDYNEYSQQQIEFLQERMTDNEPFECFIKRHVHSFLKYWKIVKYNDEVAFSDDDVPIKQEWIPNKDNKEIIIQYVLLKSFKNVYNFEKSININEFFIILLTQLLVKLDYEDIQVFKDSDGMNKELVEDSQLLYSWSAKKNRRNQLLLMNVASNVISIAPNCSELLFNKEKLLFNNDYLSSLEMEKNFYNLEKVIFQHIDKYSSTFPELVERKADLIEYFKICQILRLDHVSVLLHDTLPYCRMLTEFGFINLDAHLVQKIIKKDIPRLAVTSHPVHKLLFGNDFEKKYTILYLHYRSINRKNWFLTDDNVNRSINNVVRSDFLSITKKELSSKNKLTYKIAKRKGESSNVEEPSLKNLIAKFKNNNKQTTSKK